MKKNSICLLLCLVLTGCASIVKGRYQEVSFQSMPDEVTVIIDGRTMGKTPLTTNLLKNSGQIVVFEKDGYKPLTMSLEKRMSGWFWGNLVFGGVLGSTTDATTGAINEYSPSQYMITLQPVASNQITSAVQKPQVDRIKEFIIVGYTNIRTDLNSGSGQYLNSLLQLLKVEVNKRKEVTARLKGLADTYPNVLEFAEQVSEITVKESSYWDGMDCNKYYCLTLVSPEAQARKISQLRKSPESSDQLFLSEIVKDAHKRIKACQHGSVIVDPSAKLDADEKAFLDYLCMIGEL